MQIDDENRSERLTILVTPKEKADIVARAKASAISVGEYLRLAARAYSGRTFDDALVEGLALRLEEHMAEVETRVDEALAEARSNLEAVRSTRRAQAA